jgi:hypothetical protein
MMKGKKKTRWLSIALALCFALGTLLLPTAALGANGGADENADTHVAITEDLPLDPPEGVQTLDAPEPVITLSAIEDNRDVGALGELPVGYDDDDAIGLAQEITITNTGNYAIAGIYTEFMDTAKEGDDSFNGGAFVFTDGGNIGEGVSLAAITIGGDANKTTVTVRPADDLAVGVYTATFQVVGTIEIPNTENYHSLLAEITLTFEVIPVAAITPGDVDFGSRTVGYGDEDVPEAQTFTITYLTCGGIAELDARIVDPTSEGNGKDNGVDDTVAFEFVDEGEDEVYVTPDAIDGTDHTTAAAVVRPKADIPIGTYTATLEITGKIGGGENAVDVVIATATLTFEVTPAAAITPGTVDFGPLTVGYADVPEAQTVTITYLTGGGIEGLNAQIVDPTSEGNEKDNGVDDAAAFELVAVDEGEGEVVYVTPDAIDDTDHTTAAAVVQPIEGIPVGTYTATLEITGKIGGRENAADVVIATATLTLTVEDAVTITPETASFSALVGYEEAPEAQTFTITNAGEAVTSLAAIFTDVKKDNEEFEGAVFEFTGDGALGEDAGLEAGTETATTTAVRVQPAVGEDALEAGTYTATLKITGKVGEDGESATLAEATLTFEILSLANVWIDCGGTWDFGTTEVGYESVDPQYITIVNNSNFELTGVTTTIDGADFEFSEGELESATLAAHDSATDTAIVSVKPVDGLAVGEHKATLSITGSRGLDLSVPLKFTVTATAAPAVEINAEHLTFGPVTAGYGGVEPQMITIKNTGNVALEGVGMNKFGEDKTAFTATSDLAGYSIPVNDIVTVTVRPVVGLGAGTYTAALEFTSSNEGIEPQTVSLTFTVNPASNSTDDENDDEDDDDDDDDTKTKTKTYPVLESFEKWTGVGTAVARIDAAYVDFLELYCNDVLLRRDIDYTVTEGSTIITISEDYLKRLKNGNYTFSAIFNDGYIVNLPIEIANDAGNSATDPEAAEPDTGDDTMLRIWIAALLLAIAGITTCAVVRHRLRARVRAM